MIARSLLARSMFLALTLVPAIAACGSDEESSAPPVRLDGVYRPADQGMVASITFTNGVDYLLVPRGCAGGACAEIGTYRIDTDKSELVLENASTHEERSMPLQIMKTTTTNQTSLVQSVRPLGDLVDPGTQLSRPGQQVTGNGSQQVTGGNGSQQLAGAVQQLLQLVQQMIMAGQQMNRDNQQQNDQQQNDANKDNANKKDPLNCAQGVPTKDTPPADALAYFARCPNGP